MDLARSYAAVLASSTDEKVVQNLVARLKERGRMKLLPGILRELQTLKARSQAIAPTLTIASEAERDTALQQVQALGFEAEQVVVDPKLIRGWRATAKGTLIDRSGKRALIDLYRNITS